MHNLPLDDVVHEAAGFDLHDHESYGMYFEELKAAGQFQMLQDARMQMLEYISMPEPLWLDWLTELKILGGHMDTRLDICAVAVQDCPFSIRIWLHYLELFEGLADSPDAHGDTLLAYDEDQIISLYRIALSETTNNLKESHCIWDKFIVFLSRAKVDAKEIKQEYLERLKIPHLTISKTYQAYSQFITTNFANDYESDMVGVSKQYDQTKAIVDERHNWEDKLSDAGFSLQMYITYIEWELSQRNRGAPTKDVALGLVRRAITAYPSESCTWELAFRVCEKAKSFQRLLKLCSMAVRACPSNATFWARLLRISYQNDECQDLRPLLSRASSVATLASSSDNMMPILSAYVLTRRLSNIEDPMATVTAVDEAEKMLGHLNLVDHEYVFPRIRIASETALGRIDRARREWKNMIKIHGQKALFWMHYYEWERRAGSEMRQTRSLLKLGCFAVEDAPQVIFDTALQFELQNGDCEEYEKMAAVVQKAGSAYFLRIQDKITAQTQPDSSAKMTSTQKRKPELSVTADKNSKRHKSRLESSEYQSDSRDREGTTIIVHGLPLDTADETIASIFSESGAIKSIKVIASRELSTSIALVEFVASEGRILAESTSTEFCGMTLIVERGSDSLLFVTNYPSEYTAGDIGAIFEDHGQVLDVRLPSLRYDQTRKFAYVQMSRSTEARIALELDGHHVGNDAILSVRLSAPASRTEKPLERPSARQIFVKSIPWSASQAEVEALFTSCGKLRSIRMPAKISNKHHDGIAFIEYENSESVPEALKLHATKFKNMTLQVSILKSRHVLARRRNSMTHDASSRVYESKAAPLGALARSKSLYLLDVADTTSVAQLRSTFEAYGQLTRVEIYPEFSGAVVEYEKVRQAGEAALLLDSKIIAGTKIVFGTYEEMTRKRSSEASAKQIIAPRSIGRRHQRLNVPSSRFSSSQTAKEQLVPASQASASTSKTQDDFRGLLKKNKL